MSYMQTVQTQIGLLLEELSDQGLHYLPTLFAYTIYHSMSILRNNCTKKQYLDENVVNGMFLILGYLYHKSVLLTAILLLSVGDVVVVLTWMYFWVNTCFSWKYKIIIT